MSDSIPQLQARLATLEQKNARLQTELGTCQQSQQALQDQVAELEESKRTLEAPDRIQRAHQEAEQAVLLEREQAATERAKLLGTVATVANLLLRSPDYTTVLSDVVRLLGEAVGSDRCAVLQNVIHSTLGKPGVRVLSEQCKSGVSYSTETTPDLEPALLWENIPEFHEKFLKAEIANFLVSDLQKPSRSIFIEQGNTSMLSVPIVAHGQPWGVVSFDNCGEPRLYDEAEIAILKVAAESIAAAIERQAQDDALRESERRYRTLFELSSEGIYRYEFDQPLSLALPIEEQIRLVYHHFYIAEANTANAALYGLEKPEAMVGLRLTDTYVAGSEENSTFLRSYVENGYSIRNAETVETDKTGQQHYFLNNAVSTAKDGYVLGGWGTVVDITDLREAQRAILQAEQDRTELLKTIASVANYLLRSSDYTTVLPEVLQILGEAAGADRCSLIKNVTDPTSGKPAVRLHTEWCRPGIQASIAHTPELESALLWEYFPEAQEKLVRGETVSFLVNDLSEPARTILLNQGNTSMTLVPIVVQSQFWGVFGFDYCGESQLGEEADTAIFAIAVDSIAAAIERQLKDDALRESERRYRTLFEISSEGIYRCEFEQPIPLSLPIDKQIDLVYRHWHLTEANATFAAMYGCDHPEELVGLRLSDAHVEDSQKNLAFVRACVENGYCIQNYESEEIDRTGQHRYFLNNVIHIIQDGYAYSGWGTQTDITELRETQQALLQAEQARVAELAKTNTALKNSLDRLAANPDLNAFLGHVLLEIVQQFQIELGYLFQYDAPTQTLQLHMRVTPGQAQLKHELEDAGAFAQTFAVADLPIWNTLLQTRQPFVITRDTAAQYVFRGTYEWQVQQQYQTGINLLLTLRDEPIGLLAFVSNQRTHFSPEELELAQALAHQATLAIQLTRLAEEAKQTVILEERNRMAREIHDTLAQTFAGIVVHQETAKEMLEDAPGEPEAQAYINRTLALAREGIAEARRSVWALYPGLLERTDLCGALQQCIEQVTTGTALQPQFQIQGTPIPLSPQIEGNLLRIGQEAVSNVLKHAQASQLQVELAFTPNQVQLCLRDDGQGFEPERQTSSGFGLVSMSERAQSIGADWSVTSAPSQGTEVKVIVPLSQPIQKLTPSSPPKDSQSLIRLLIADDHTVVRQGIAAMLERELDLTVVAQASNGQQALDLFHQHRPDVGLIDLRMPSADGVAAIRAIRAEFPAARLIVLTIYDGDEDIYRGLRAGAKGYLLKDAPRENLLECIRSVHQGESFIPSAVGAKLAERMSSPNISDRERSVLRLMATGKSNREIGAVLCISEGTVKSHINNILSKFQVDDRTHAVVTALQRGIISL